MFANLLYVVALMAGAPLIAYRMIRHGRYRRGLRQKLLGLSRREAIRLRGSQPCLWIHAVSVGEVNLVAGLAAELARAQPETVLVVSTSTDTGFDLAVDRFGADRVFFCPLDFTWAVRRTLRNLDPTQLILTELELWPNLIRCCQRRSCPVSVVNARLSQRSARQYARFSALLRPTFARLNWVGCQDEAVRDRFAACGVARDRLEITGSIKFDGAPTTRESAEVQSRLQWTLADPWHRIWMVGSSGPGEESMALDIYNHLRVDHDELRLILVPRHRERFNEVAQLIADRGLTVRRRSTHNPSEDPQWNAETVILIDTVGELRHWWGVAQIATVGGTFGSRGGQNMLEPAGYGCAISFGPNTRNFQTIADTLLAADAAVRTVDASELARFVRRCLTKIPAADALGRSAVGVVAQHRGATRRTVRALTSCPAQTGSRKAA